METNIDVFFASLLLFLLLHRIVEVWLWEGAQLSEDDNGGVLIIADFQYVVQRARKSKICFGSGIERDENKPTSRHNIEYTACPLPNLSPGMYPIAGDPKGTRPLSVKGTVLGGRTAPRYPSPRPSETPPPGAYNIPDPLGRAHSFKGTARFKKEPKYAVVGPGYYKGTASHRTMAYAYSFGGKRRLIPAIKMKCGPVNLDACDRCKKPPVGDYWQLTQQNFADDGSNGEPDTWFLCRPCHERERKKPTLFSKHQIQQFKKVRDCSKVHFHDGCDARLLLLPPRDIDKIQEKEAYLALYFP